MKRLLGVLTLVVLAGAVLAPAIHAQGRCRCGCGHGHGWGAGPRWAAGSGGGIAAASPLSWQGPRYDPDTVTTLRGTIAAIEIEPAQSGRHGGVHLMIEAEGKTTEVHLGPTWFVNEQDVKLAKGDRVEVVGSVAATDKGKYLIAREVKKGGAVLKLRDAQGLPAWAGRGWRAQP